MHFTLFTSKVPADSQTYRQSFRIAKKVNMETEGIETSYSELFTCKCPQMSSMPLQVGNLELFGMVLQ